MTIRIRYNVKLKGFEDAEKPPAIHFKWAPKVNLYLLCRGIYVVTKFA